MKAARDFAVLRQPAFRRYFVGRSVSELGTAMTQVALPFAVFAIGGDVGDVGLVLGAAVLPKVVLVLLGGVAGDRLERRRVLLGTDVCMALCQAVTALLLLSGTGQVWHLALLQVAYGCAGAFALPATTGAVPDIAPKDLLQQANSLMRVARNAFGILGPPCAGVLVAVAGPGWALAVDAASFVAAAVAMAGVPAGLRTRRPHARLLRDVAEGWETFTSKPWIWMMVTSFAVYQATVLPAIYVAGPGIAESTVGVTGWAAVLTARAVGALAAGFPLLRWRPHRPLMLAAALLLLDVPFLLALWSGSGLAVLLLCATVAAAGLNAADTLWETALQERVPPGVIARVSSYDWLGSLAFAPLGYAAVGGAVDGFGVRSTLLVITATHVVIHIALPCLGSVRRTEHLDTTVAVPLEVGRDA
ncbi:MFS transporter [Streptomyces sp. NPDC005303]|uniref:MFS transporter n=1 Tax=Streptomyces sp. NPDC005303 TaxID=3155713 RepID=UPI0033B7EBF8